MSSISTKATASTFCILVASLILNTVVSLSHSTNKETRDFFTVGRDRSQSKGCNNEFHGISSSFHCQKPTASQAQPPLQKKNVTLVFADKRLAVIYSINQRLNSIFT